MAHSCPIHRAVDGAQAPAVQLQEHAAALLVDDADMGVKRGDSFLKALAKSDASHSVTQWQLATLAFKTYVGMLETSGTNISRVQTGKHTERCLGRSEPRQGMCFALWMLLVCGWSSKSRKLTWEKPRTIHLSGLRILWRQWTNIVPWTVCSPHRTFTRRRRFCRNIGNGSVRNLVLTMKFFNRFLLNILPLQSLADCMVMRAGVFWTQNWVVMVLVYIPKLVWLLYPVTLSWWFILKLTILDNLGVHFAAGVVFIHVTVSASKHPKKWKDWAGSSNQSNHIFG